MSAGFLEDDFQRLNDQLVELKTQNYNLESCLKKTTLQNNSLVEENEQLRRQLSSISRSETNSGQSIKQKLNPFAFAKSIANKVDSRIHQSSQINDPTNVVNEIKSPPENIAEQLESQETDFFKTNELLKNEINLLQEKIDKLEAEKQGLKCENEQLQKEQQRIDLEMQSNEPMQLCFSTFFDVFCTRSLDNDVHLWIESVDYEQLHDKLISLVRDDQNADNDLIEDAIDSIVLSEDKSDITHCDHITTVKHFEELCVSLRKSHFVQVAKLKKIIEFQLDKLNDLLELRTELESQTQTNSESFMEQINTLQEEKQELMTKLSMTEQKLSELQSHCDEEINKKEQCCNEIVQKLDEEHKHKLKVVSAQLEECFGQLDESKSQIEAFKSKLADSINERKISEKKGLKLIKELKKQLNSEKNRADKLQSVLKSDLIHDEGGKNSFDVSTTNSSTDAQVPFSDKCSSSGSWSYMNESTFEVQSPNAKHKDTSVRSEFSDLEVFDSHKTVSLADSDSPNHHSSQHNNHIPHYLNGSNISVQTKQSRVPSSVSIASIGLEQENKQLVSQILNLQQEKWRLGEQVNQLEHEIHRLANELVEKNKLIQHYCIEGKSDRAQKASSPASSGGGGRIIGDHRTLRSPSLSTTSITTTTKPSLNNSVLRVVSFLKEKSELVSSGGDNGKQMAEVNRKLQRMVEEILTKNMHLQNNMDELSQELMTIKQKLQQYEHCEPVSTTTNPR